MRGCFDLRGGFPPLPWLHKVLYVTTGLAKPGRQGGCVVGEAGAGHSHDTSLGVV